MATATKRTDNFPNYLSFTLVQSAVDTFTTTKIFTPIPRNQVSGNKATVMEVLWVDVICVDFVLNNAAETIAYGLSTGGPPLSQITIAQGSAVFSAHFGNLSMSGAAFTDTRDEWPKKYDLQSKDGYGFLLATDSINFWADSSATAKEQTYSVRVWYRFVQIPVQEYIGVVQSQTSSN